MVHSFLPFVPTHSLAESVCPSPQGAGNNWLRVIPRTRFGAFARGAKVVLFTRQSGAHLRIIDGGSGYLCEMEPVAHFGLGECGGVGSRAWSLSGVCALPGLFSSCPSSRPSQ